MLLVLLGAACGSGSHSPEPDAALEALEDGGSGADAEAALDAAAACATPDADGDGYASLPCDGDDCDDGDPLVHPGAYDHGGWTILPVEGPSADTSTTPALATDAAGLVHLVLGSSAGLWHASMESDWTAEVIDPSSTWGACMVGTADGALHVGYLADVGESSTELRYAVRESDRWVRETVVEAATITSACSIAEDPSGQLHIAYEIAQRAGWYRLEVSARADGEWVPEIFEESSTARAKPSIAFTPDGEIHAVANDPGSHGLLHYFLVGDAWDHELVDHDGGWGRPELIAYGAGLAVVYNDGEVATWSDGFWTRDVFTGFYGGGPDLAAGAAHRLHLSGYGLSYIFDAGKLPFVMYGSLSPAGEWTWETIAESSGGLTAIALDSEERPHVAYVEDGTMYLAWRDGLLDGVDQNCDGEDGHARW